jgi:hypothetical protein
MFGGFNERGHVIRRRPSSLTKKKLGVKYKNTMAQIAMIAGLGMMCLSSSVGAALMMGGGEEDDGAGAGGANDQDNDTPTEYVYEFIVKEQTAHTNKWNIHITDIEADGVRVTSEQLEINQEPEHAKCNSKAGKYECEGDNYGINDPEPADDPHYKDLTWSAWTDVQAKVGDKVFTITMPSKVSKFTIDYFRPKYVPGWTIKENGTEVLSTSKGANEDTPIPIAVEYEIP